MNSKKTVITSQRLQGLFSEIGKVITSSLELPKITEAIMNQVNLFFQPRNWSLFRLDPDTQELYFVVAKGINIKKLSTVRLKHGEGVAGYVAQTGKPMYVKNAESSPYFSKKVDKLTGFKTKSIIAVPIIFNKKVFGVIELVNAFQDRSFSKRELDLLKTIADFSAIALTHALAFEQILWLATHDSLTGLHNLEYLNNLLEHCDHPHADHKKPFAIAAWIDVNDLKQVNDYYGHHMGNKVLTTIAELLKSLSDKTTSVIRFGGDEFIVILLNISKTDIKKEIMYLQKKLTYFSQHISPSAGFSFGIAHGKKQHLAQVIQEADRRMYKQKRARNTYKKSRA